MTDLPDASTIRRAIEQCLMSEYPRYRTYWECRTPEILVHRDWIGSNWTWSAIAEPADLQMIASVAEYVRKLFPRATS